MKLFLAILKIIGITIATGLIVLFLTKDNQFRCSTLDVFSNEPYYVLYFDLLKSMLVAAAIWMIGFFIYFVMKKKKQINLLFYFVLLTVISLSSYVINASTIIPKEIKKMELEICSKSSDDGMILTYTSLNIEEYNFINSNVSWLPSIPKMTEAVDINYYRDGFLGDFYLIVEIILPNDEKLDSAAYPKWILNDGKYTYRLNVN